MGSKWTINTIKVGSVWTNNLKHEFEVVDYSSALHVTVMFKLTGSKVITTSYQIRQGSVKDPLQASVLGVGFYGIGKFKSKIKGRHTKAYSSWRHMLRRCYDQKTQEKNPSYIGCTVCKEWHNFQNFAKWFYERMPDTTERFEVNKDIRVIGNRVYSPETCLLVHHSVNKFILDSKSSRGESLIGSSYSKSSSKYSSYCNNPNSDKMDHLGYFSGELEAHMAWRNKKCEYAIMLANQQEREEVKIALLDWAKALRDFRIHPIAN